VQGEGEAGSGGVQIVHGNLDEQKAAKRGLGAGAKTRERRAHEGDAAVRIAASKKR
jgi:hypothetical protein